MAMCDLDVAAARAIRPACCRADARGILQGELPAANGGVVLGPDVLPNTASRPMGDNRAAHRDLHRCIARTGSLRAAESACRGLAGLVQRDLFRLDDRAIRDHDDSSSGATLATWYHSDLVSHGSGELPVSSFALPLVDGDVAR